MFPPSVGVLHISKGGSGKSGIKRGRSRAITSDQEHDDFAGPSSDDDISPETLVSLWKSAITGAGQQCTRVPSYTLQKYATSNDFEFKLKKHNKNRVVGECSSEGCSWKFNAVWVPSTKSFKIKTMNNVHTCDKESKNWLLDTIKERLQDTPRLKPNEIAKGLLKDYGFESKSNHTQVCPLTMVSYEQFHGSDKDAYNKLPWFCEKIKVINAYDWVMQIEPQHWTVSSLKGERYNYITDDVSEPFSKLMEEYQELPILHKIDAIIRTMMDGIDDAKLDGSVWSTRLTPSKEKQVQEEIVRSCGLKVLISSDTLFEAREDSTHVVNIGNWSCTCLGWKETGLPCRHALAVFAATGKNLYEFCSNYFSVDVYR